MESIHFKDVPKDHYIFGDMQDEDAYYCAGPDQVEHKNSIVAGYGTEEKVPDEYTVKAFKLERVEKTSQTQTFSKLGDLEVSFPINRMRGFWYRVENRN